jgi:hypothetical protein
MKMFSAPHMFNGIEYEQFVATHPFMSYNKFDKLGYKVWNCLLLAGMKVEAELFRFLDDRNKLMLYKDAKIAYKKLCHLSLIDRFENATPIHKTLVKYIVLTQLIEESVSYEDINMVIPALHSILQINCDDCDSDSDSDSDSSGIDVDCLLELKQKLAQRLEDLEKELKYLKNL